MSTALSIRPCEGPMTEYSNPTPLGRRLRELRRARGWSQRQFADIAGIATGTVSQLETGLRGQRIGREVVLRIAKAFHEPEEWWLDLAGLGHDGQVTNFRPTFNDYVDADPHLTEQQKLALKTSYASFTSSRRRRRVDSPADE